MASESDPETVEGEKDHLYYITKAKEKLRICLMNADHSPEFKQTLMEQLKELTSQTTPTPAAFQQSPSSMQQQQKKAGSGKPIAQKSLSFQSTDSALGGLQCNDILNQNNEDQDDDDDGDDEVNHLLDTNGVAGAGDVSSMLEKSLLQEQLDAKEHENQSLKQALAMYRAQVEMQKHHPPAMGQPSHGPPPNHPAYYQYQQYQQQQQQMMMAMMHQQHNMYASQMSQLGPQGPQSQTATPMVRPPQPQPQQPDLPSASQKPQQPLQPSLQTTAPAPSQQQGLPPPPPPPHNPASATSTQKQQQLPQAMPQHLRQNSIPQQQQQPHTPPLASSMSSGSGGFPPALQHPPQHPMQNWPRPGMMYASNPMTPVMTTGGMETPSDLWWDSFSPQPSFENYFAGLAQHVEQVREESGEGEAPTLRDPSIPEEGGVVGGEGGAPLGTPTQQEQAAYGVDVNQG